MTTGIDRLIVESFEPEPPILNAMFLVNSGHAVSALGFWKWEAKWETEHPIQGFAQRKAPAQRESTIPNPAQREGSEVKRDC